MRISASPAPLSIDGPSAMIRLFPPFVPCGPWVLVYASALVGAHKFLQRIALQFAVVALNHYFVGNGSYYDAAVLSYYANSGVISNFMPMPVPIIGASGQSKGTACLYMLEPINALLASSFLRKVSSWWLPKQVLSGQRPCSQRLPQGILFYESR